MDIQDVVKSYSPWLSEETASEWSRIQKALPEFRRPIFEALVADICGNHQMVSLTGPRRVGKTTLLWQLVRKMIDEEKLDPKRIIYYSLDDPALYRPGLNGAQVLEALMEHMAELGKTGPAYLLLDEIQTLQRWELYLKKYYDLKYPIQIVISGSASSPIFKASRESLLGRIIDHHVLPFSFREYLLYTFSTTRRDKWSNLCNHSISHRHQSLHSTNSVMPCRKGWGELGNGRRRDALPRRRFLKRA